MVDLELTYYNMLSNNGVETYENIPEPSAAENAGPPYNAGQMQILYVCMYDCVFANCQTAIIGTNSTHSTHFCHKMTYSYRGAN